MYDVRSDIRNQTRKNDLSFVNCRLLTKLINLPCRHLTLTPAFVTGRHRVRTIDLIRRYLLQRSVNIRCIHLRCVLCVNYLYVLTHQYVVYNRENGSKTAKINVKTRRLSAVNKSRVSQRHRNAQVIPRMSDFPH